MTTKKECPKCKRKLRTRCFRKHKLTGEQWCKSCIKKYGENKFNFNPNIPFREHHMVTKYALSTEEENLLRRKKGNKEVNRVKGFLRWIKENKRKKNIAQTIERNEQLKKNKQMNEKLIEGLQ